MIRLETGRLSGGYYAEVKAGPRTRPEEEGKARFDFRGKLTDLGHQMAMWMGEIDSNDET